jgi:adenosylcobinamide-GDP ribazoletransferase
VRATGTAIPPIFAPLLAVQFLTILPPIVRRSPSPADLARAEVFFPLVGALVGLGLATLDALLVSVFSLPLRCGLVIAAMAAITGALHLDGVIDTFDGIFAGGGTEQRLAIMRDPRAGAFGVVAVVTLLLLQYTALISLEGTIRTVALVLGPCFGRWAIVQATSCFDYARPSGLGRDFTNALTPRHAMLAWVLTAVIAWAASGTVGLAMFGLVLVVVHAAAAWMASRLGGLTGDTYGTLCELAQITTWIALSSTLMANAS